jgi:hypothetical protein
VMDAQKFDVLVQARHGDLNSYLVHPVTVRMNTPDHHMRNEVACTQPARRSHGRCRGHPALVSEAHSRRREPVFLCLFE